MYKKWLSALFLTVVFAGGAFAETCGTPTYTVTYSCGDGTVTGALPADGTATYGKSFTPTMLTTSMCTAPAGYHLVGIEIWDVDGDIGGYATKTSAFTYYYTTGITIKPHYVTDSDYVTVLWNLRSVNGSSHKSDNAAMTWATTFGNYGTVSGIAACSKVKPLNMASGSSTGFIADDQDAIKNEGGLYCYCKMTEPSFEGSLWVFLFNSSTTGCASNCAGSCGYNLRSYAAFRGSVFRGARPN